MAVAFATSPAAAAVHSITYDPTTGQFTPAVTLAHAGDTVVWSGLGRSDAVVRIRPPGSSATHDDVCFADAAAGTAPLRRAYRPGANEFTGPTRNGVSGIWALGPEGSEVSLLELPLAPDADDGLNGAATECEELNATLTPVDVTDDTTGLPAKRVYAYEVLVTKSGAAGRLLGTVTGGATVGGPKLCEATSWNCPTTFSYGGAISAAAGCRPVEIDLLDPLTIPPGAHPNGLLASTYANPDVTGVVLRFSWKDLQVFDGTDVVNRWDDLDRELEAAVAHGKLVTIDVRAGFLGTPAWIFTDFTAAPGPVEPIWFRDHYNETPDGSACGSLIKIGAPGDPAYEALYAGFVSALAEHVASDTRWFQALAHVKVSGANLQTSEAELPHHCDDQFINTIDHHAGPIDDNSAADGDGVLDVFKTVTAAGRRTNECACNPKIWADHGYTPASLYGYYAAIENQLLRSFFGKKSMGFQIIQDGFPRVDADAWIDRDGDGVVDPTFFGDHLYREVLEPWSPLAAPGPSCGDGVVDPGEACDDGNLRDNDGCASDCTVAANLGFTAEATCPATTRVGLRPHVDDTGAAPRYCSADDGTWLTATWAPPLDPTDVYLAHATFALEPVGEDPTNPSFAYPDDGGAGRYPGAFTQTEHVLDDAAWGRFSQGAGDGLDPMSGRLFVPQHSGLQPLPQEQIELGYDATNASPCAQQRPAPVVDPAGGWSAPFPIPRDEPVISTLHDAPGCPNRWIVEQGVRGDELAYASGWTTVTLPTHPAPFPGALPPREIQVPTLETLQFPPMLTGFQTTNKVRSTAQVESALFNLVYNTNAVFIELYEDAIWRISTARGSAPMQDRLDQLGCAFGAGDPLCYSKSLHDWAEELHRRRRTVATAWADLDGLHYPALEDPFPDEHAFSVEAPSGAYDVLAFINPSTCARSPVASGPPAPTSALGTIIVLP